MGKFDNKEANRVAVKSTAKSMSGQNNKAARKLVSFQATPDMYNKFTYINEQLGITNTAALNLFIATYVKEHADMI